MFFFVVQFCSCKDANVQLEDEHDSLFEKLSNISETYISHPISRESDDNTELKQEIDTEVKILEADGISFYIGCTLGAETGAITGTLVCPGVGTLAGTVIESIGEGICMGALSSIITRNILKETDNPEPNTNSEDNTQKKEGTNSDNNSAISPFNSTIVDSIFSSDLHWSNIGMYHNAISSKYMMRILFC